MQAGVTGSRERTQFIVDMQDISTLGGSVSATTIDAAASIEWSGEDILNRLPRASLIDTSILLEQEAQDMSMEEHLPST